MQDVIFAGTRERKALGMAEVTLTLVDPEAYEGPIPVEPLVRGGSRRPRRLGRGGGAPPAGQRGRGDHRQRAAGPGARRRRGTPERPPSRRRSRRRGSAGGGAEDSPPQVSAHAAKGRGGDYAAALPHRRERVPAERQALPAARHSGHLHGHGPGAGELRDHRPGADRAAAQLQAARPAGDHRGGGGDYALQDQEAAGRAAPGERQAESGARGRHLRGSHAADEQPEAAGVQG